MKQTGTIIKNLLLIFVLVSIGFAFGKYSVAGPRAALPSGPAETVNVYYMHATFRCVTCNTIEKMTKQLLESKYKKQMQDGSILFSAVDFQKNEPMAKQFDVISSCVVVARTKDGKTTVFERLDKVWELLDKPDEFNAYISSAIDKLSTTGGAK
ncbi:MAG: nitrophenyl compound nitroreductase subunit ArsF family protein [Victivallaceae bacterium]|jgi:hypothetical protein